MSRRDDAGDNWPYPVEISRENILTDKVKLSDLTSEERARAFAKMKETAPGMAKFLQQMARAFGKGELFVDKDTAKRLGVKL